MSGKDKGASADADRAVEASPSSPSVSPVPASISSADLRWMLADLAFEECANCDGTGVEDATSQSCRSCDGVGTTAQWSGA